MVRAPRGPQRSARSWGAEAALRMLHNNLDPEVAERPDDLVVYGGSGKAARDWRCFDAITETLRTMAPDDTLLVQSGKPVGVVRTTEQAPRVLIANSLLVPKWATPEHFRELEDAGLTMYGQMTAGSWIYIGTQGILQGTYATFAEVATQHFGGTLAGTVTLTAGLGGMGGAQPLAVTGNGGAVLCVEVDPARARRRLEGGFLDAIAGSLDEGLELVDEAKRDRRALSVAVIGNAAETHPELVRRGWAPDVVTDQTSAHDALHGYVPVGMSVEEAPQLAPGQAGGVRRAGPRLDGRALRRDARLPAGRRGRLRLRQRAARAGAGRRRRRRVRLSRASSWRTCGRCSPAAPGPFRWACLSGDPADLAATDDAVLAAFPDDDGLQRWIRFARDEGARARGCRPGSAGWGTASGTSPARRSTTWSRRGRADRAGRRSAATTSTPARSPRPERETEGMRDGSDAIADWPILNALLNTASGASWVSVHHGGGVGIGKSIHAGVVVVAEGTAESRARVERVLTNDPGSGVLRHADAGYEIAERTARDVGIRIPLQPGTHAPAWQRSDARSDGAAQHGPGRRPAGPARRAGGHPGRRRRSPGRPRSSHPRRRGRLGRPGRPGAVDDHRRARAGRRRRLRGAGLRRPAHARGLGGQPAGGVRGAGWSASGTTAAASPPRCAATAAAGDDELLRAGGRPAARDGRQRHDDGRGEDRVRARAGRRAAAAAAGRPARRAGAASGWSATLLAHVVPAGVDRAAHVAALAAALPEAARARGALGRRLLRPRGVHRRRRRASCCGPAPRPASAAGCTPSSSPHRRGRARRRVRLRVAPTTWSRSTPPARGRWPPPAWSACCCRPRR